MILLKAVSKIRFGFKIPSSPCEKRGCAKKGGRPKDIFEMVSKVALRPNIGYNKSELISHRE
jgi:hypothetical protein